MLFGFCGVCVVFMLGFLAFLWLFWFQVFCVKNAPSIVPTMSMMPARISLLKLWNTIMYVVSNAVNAAKAVIAKYMA